MINRRCVLSAPLGFVLTGGAQAADEDDLPPLYTPALARKLEPAMFPFAAEYADGTRKLLFIAARHEIGQDTRTARLVRLKIGSFRPGLVIIEGPTSASGRNPADLIRSMRDDGEITADPTAGENRVAAETALRSGVEFQGGEPTGAQLFSRLAGRNFDKQDLLFADTLKVMPSLVRAGQITSAADTRFPAVYSKIAERVAQASSLPPMPLETFKTKYVQIFGVDPGTDQMFMRRANPDDTNVIARILQAQGQLRDRALLDLIREALAGDTRVLVVYGGSHWTTLSGPLAALLGPPTFDLSLATPTSSR